MFANAIYSLPRVINDDINVDLQKAVNVDSKNSRDHRLIWRQIVYGARSATRCYHLTT